MTMALILFVLCICLNSGLAQPPVKTITIGTHYTTVDVKEFEPNARHIFAASTCNNFDTFEVRIGLLLFHNPKWILGQGIVYFYVTDVQPQIGEPVSPDAMLCSNQLPNDTIVSNCTVASWNKNSTMLYVATTNGNVGGIAFSLDVEFSNKYTKNKRMTKEIKAIKRSNNTWISPALRRPLKIHEADITYLRQTVKGQAFFNMTYGENVLLTFAVCPDTVTTKHYDVTSTIFGMDVHSAFNQYMCLGLPCDPQHNNIASNPYELPLSTCTGTTASAGIKTVYVSVYCWGGKYDRGKDKIIGVFQYGATVDPK